MFKDSKRNWKTTIGGALALAMAGYRIWNDPKSIQDPEIVGAISVGLGLIFAKDGDKTGIADVESTKPDAH